MTFEAEENSQPGDHYCCNVHKISTVVVVVVAEVHDDLHFD